MIYLRVQDEASILPADTAGHRIHENTKQHIDTPEVTPFEVEGTSYCSIRMGFCI